jgi:hypothetical protein
MGADGLGSSRVGVEGGSRQHASVEEVIGSTTGMIV